MQSLLDHKAINPQLVKNDKRTLSPGNLKEVNSSKENTNQNVHISERIIMKTYYIRILLR